MIKVDVISGFLGAGKTTLIKKMYQHAFSTEKVVLVENEFGQVGIDGAFLKEAGIEIKEINSGCICCTLVGDFNKSLQEIIDRFAPERIIIEPSGVGKLSDIMESIERFAALELNIVATVVDAGKCRMYMRNFGEFYIDQVKQANTVVLSKGDVCGEKKLQDAFALIKELNPRANIVSTEVTALDSALLLSTLEKDINLMDELMEEVKEQQRAHHHEHHYDENGNCSCGHHHDEEDECHCHEHKHEHHCHHDEDEEHEHCCHHHDDEGNDKHECHCHEHHDEECGCGHHHEHEHHEHGHDADEVFESWGVTTVKGYTHAELENILMTLCGERLGVILRAKGIVRAKDNESWYYFDLVAGDYEIRLGAPDVTGKLCVIGASLDKSALEVLF